MSHDSVFSDTPLANALGVFSILFFGWPFYLLFNSTGPAKYEDKPHRSHFNPISALFTDSQRFWVAVSDVGFFAMVIVVLYWIQNFGFINVLFFYLAPLAVVNAHLVLITFLQHTDTYVPHFTAKEFTWLRGALCTIDRPYGFGLDYFFHRITDTHVAHHLFRLVQRELWWHPSISLLVLHCYSSFLSLDCSHMPFYHAAEATKYIKQVVGQYYLRDETPVPQAAMRAWSQCRFLEDGEDIAFFKNAQAWEEGEKAYRASKKFDEGKKRTHSKSR
jgi:omega-6 fatty acid desaturase / acyl-lipid omega-6 desaturase (Delta-12 desaturase)